MRVAQIVSGLDGGGLEKMVTELTVNLQARGHVVEVFSLGDEGLYAKRLRTLGVTVHHPHRDRVHIPGITVHLRRALAKFQPDLLHAHSGTWYQAASARRSLRSIPLIFTDHGRYPSEGPVHHMVERWAATAIDSLVTVSAPLAEQVRTVLRMKHPPTIVENGIDLSPYSPDPHRRRSLRAEWGFQEKDVIVAIVGRLESVKNHRGLFDAFHGAAARAPMLGMVVLGAGSLEEELRTLATNHGIMERVRFLGFRDDIPQCLLASDVLAMPSHTEGLPLALLEGMAAGLPVVASPVGGIPATLGEYPPWLLPAPGDNARLAESLERLALDQRLRDDLGARMRERAASYSVEQMTSAYEALYVTCRATAA